jgi:hypothetical protein
MWAYAIVLVLTIDGWLGWARSTDFARQHVALYLTVCAMMVVWLLLLMRWGYKRATALIPKRGV